MDKTSETFVEVLEKYVNGSGCGDIDFSGVDWEKLSDLIQLQGVGGIFFSCLKDCSNIDQDFLRKIQVLFLKEVRYYQSRVLAFETLRQLFNDNQIKFVYVKGTYIATLYPDEELRGMSDIDILIEAEDRERSHDILLKAGARYIVEKNNGDVWGYIFHGIKFEVHTNLVSNKNVINGIDYYQYFSQAIHHIKKVEKSAYILEEDFNLIYTIYHISKHFRFSGCGIRMLLDLPFLIRNSKHDFSWDYIWDELEKLKLKEFTCRLFKICEEWFGKLGVDYPDNFVIPNMEMVQEFILAGGVFGLNGRSTDAFQIKSFGNKEIGGFSYIKGMLRWAFPSCRKMRNYSPWFKDKPAILLPVAYVIRFVENAKERGGIWNWGKSLTKGKRDLDEKQMMLSIMELE